MIDPYRAARMLPAASRGEGGGPRRVTFLRAAPIERIYTRICMRLHREREGESGLLTFMERNE